ncbi:hypothetical protein AAHH21_03230 [Stenotrophomonas sp. BSUC-16]|uniref:Proline/alanine-rich repetetive membrane anchored protein n=1 Tax=Stenotrophomonas maltophilia TaxID=40324 RepID=A0A246HZ87_STEMA|nr:MULTISPECIES: hypothetical protein [Stenotrophomonas maltophilia group]MCZ7846021.1 hypothetical protein [Stenotrophomonas maltophilia]MDJ1626940.1 hypothetical protein [Stenotrophomonas sepilia]OWQ70623.1 hypothetical protein CEE63_17505 [Stenotrophomonas maltophilia]PZT39822.1 hypothetical protein A7X97_07095 [Stenotrophomonas sepilia]
MNRDEPLTPEERELARLLGRRAEQAPPAALDAAILAAARAAVDAPGTDVAASPEAPRKQRTGPRWPAVFGIAASMVFAIGIAWQLRPEPPPVPAGETAVAAAPAAAEDVATADQAAGSGSAHSAVAVAEPAAAPAAPESAPVSAAPAPAIARAHKPAPAKTAEVPAQAARSMAADAAADTSFATLPSAPAAAPPAPPAPTAYSAPAPAFAPAASGAMKARTAAAPAANATEAERAQALDRVEITSMKREAPSRSAPGVMRRGSDAGLSADAVQAEVDADARLPRRQWLQKIRARRDDGQRDLARASLERYVQQYPEARLPRDLRPLLDD